MSLPEIFDIAAPVFSYSPKLCRDVSVVWICSLLVMCFWDPGSCVNWTHAGAALRPPQASVRRLPKGAQHPLWREGLFHFTECCLITRECSRSQVGGIDPLGTTEYTMLPVAQRAFVSAPPPAMLFIGYACFCRLLQFLDYC